jgi:excisionase family DNA binding protein
MLTAKEMQFGEALPLVLTVSDLQKVLRVSRVKAYELVNQQGFPTVRFGRVIRIPRDGLLKWLEAQ